MSTEEAVGIVTLARRAGMSVVDIAKEVGCSTRTLARWAEGSVTTVQEAVARNLRALRDELKGAKK